MFIQKKPEASLTSNSFVTAKNNVEQSTAKYVSDVKVDDSTKIKSKLKSGEGFLILKIYI